MPLTPPKPDTPTPVNPTPPSSTPGVSLAPMEAMTSASPMLNNFVGKKIIKLWNHVYNIYSYVLSIPVSNPLSDDIVNALQNPEADANNMFVTESDISAVAKSLIDQEHSALTKDAFNSISPVTQEEYDNLVLNDEIEEDCIYLIKETI